MDTLILVVDKSLSHLAAPLRRAECLIERSYGSRDEELREQREMVKMVDISSVREEGGY